MSTDVPMHMSMHARTLSSTRMLPERMDGCTGMDTERKRERTSGTYSWVSHVPRTVHSSVPCVRTLRLHLMPVLCACTLCLYPGLVPYACTLGLYLMPVPWACTLCLYPAPVPCVTVHQTGSSPGVLIPMCCDMPSAMPMGGPSNTRWRWRRLR